ncbi:unnamed protein product [Sphagnum balticum]
MYGTSGEFGVASRQNLNILGNSMNGNMGITGSTAQFFGNVDYDPANPLNWPFVIMNGLDGYNAPDEFDSKETQDRLMYLANVKYIPVGLTGNARPTANFTNATYQSNNFCNTAVYVPSATTFTYTVSLPIISGLLGSMSDKMLPIMLYAPGSLYMQWKLATNYEFLQVSMDPCRRLYGTNRDYIPWGGSIGGIFGQPKGFTASVPQTSQGNTEGSEGYGGASLYTESINGGSPNAGGYFSITASGDNTVSSTALTTMTVGLPTLYTSFLGPSGGTFKCSQSGQVANEIPSSQYYANQFFTAGNPTACIGVTLASATANLSKLLSTTSYPKPYLCFSPMSIASMEGKQGVYELGETFIDGQLYGFATEGTNVVGNTYGYNFVCTAPSTSTVFGLPTVPQQANQGGEAMVNKQNVTFAGPVVFGGQQLNAPYTSTATQFEYSGPNIAAYPMNYQSQLNTTAGSAATGNYSITQQPDSTNSATILQTVHRQLLRITIVVY